MKNTSSHFDSEIVWYDKLLIVWLSFDACMWEITLSAAITCRHVVGIPFVITRRRLNSRCRFHQSRICYIQEPYAFEWYAGNLVALHYIVFRKFQKLCVSVSNLCTYLYILVNLVRVACLFTCYAGGIRLLFLLYGELKCISCCRVEK